MIFNTPTLQLFSIVVCCHAFQATNPFLGLIMYIIAANMLEIAHTNRND